MKSYELFLLYHQLNICSKSVKNLLSKIRIKAILSIDKSVENKHYNPIIVLSTRFNSHYKPYLYNNYKPRIL